MLIFPLKAFERRNNGLYTTAKKLGLAALILDLICGFSVAAACVITVGIPVGCTHGTLCPNYI